MLKEIDKELFKMKKLAVLLLASGLGFGANSAVQADEVRVPVGAQKQSSVETPKRGISKSQVRKKFGEPSSVKGPVGSPPITTWHYGNMTVYFEYNHVVHAVVHAG